MRRALCLIARPLAALGRQGARAVAVLVFLGIVVPPLSELLRPFVTEAVFVLLCLAFARVELTTAAEHLRRPRLVLAAIIWTSIVIPCLFALTLTAFTVDTRSPDLFLGLALQGVTSPTMAAPALAALIGLDATVVLFALIGSSVLLPVTAPAFAHYLLDASFTIPPLELGARLFGLLAGSAAIGLIVRRLVGAANISRYSDEIDGINILVLFIFIVALMGGVGSRLLDEPLFVLGLTALTFFIFGIIFILTCLIFAAMRQGHSLSIAFMAAQRNTGLMIAGTAGSLPEVTWLYFALTQVPIYMSPYLLGPVVRRFGKQETSR